MPRATWKNRKEFIWKCAFEVQKSFEGAKKFLLDHPMFGAAGVDVDIDGIMNKYFSDYMYKVEWATDRQHNAAKLDIINQAYSFADRCVWSGEFKNVLKRHWEGLQA